MVNRYHIDVIVSTSDDLSKSDVELFVDDVLLDVEYDPDVYRAYVAGDELSESEKDVLLESLFRLSDEELMLAAQSVSALEE